MTVPILFASVGEVYTERSGVLNLSVEGIMTVSAFFALWTTFLTGSYFNGILAGIAIALFFGLFFAFVCVKITVNQLIAGLLFYTLGIAIADFSYRYVLRIAVPIVEPLPPLKLPILRSIPYIGTILFEHNVLVYISFVIPIIMGLILYKTVWGLKIRSVGENPQAADAAGVKVNLIRFLCVIIGAAFAGLGGSYITLGHLGTYVAGGATVAGRGWIAILVAILSGWNPYRCILGSWIFGLGYAIAAELISSYGGSLASSYFFLMIPYIFALIVILVFRKTTRPPAALTVPYKRK